jgi:hypothetical protein
MVVINIREQLSKQIEKLPDEVVEEIADFTMFIMARRQIKPEYEDWNEKLWQDFALQQFFREDEEVDYTLNDAQEVYRP